MVVLKFGGKVLEFDVLSLVSGAIGVLIGVVASEVISERDIKLEHAKMILDSAVEFVSLLQTLEYVIEDPNRNVDEIIKVSQEIQPYQYKLDVLIINKEDTDIYKIHSEATRIVRLYNEYMIAEQKGAPLTPETKNDFDEYCSKENLNRVIKDYLIYINKLLSESSDKVHIIV